MPDKKVYRNATIRDKDGKTVAEPDKVVVAIVSAQKARIPHPYGEFAIMNANAMLELSKSDLSPLEMRLFLRLIGEMPIGNEGVVNQTDAAEVMGVSRESINRAMASLADGGYISKQTRGRALMVRINPAYAWKGSTADLVREYRTATEKKAKTRRKKFTVVDGGKTKHDPATGEILD